MRHILSLVAAVVVVVLPTLALAQAPSIVVPPVVVPQTVGATTQGISDAVNPIVKPPEAPKESGK